MYVQNFLNKSFFKKKMNNKVDKWGPLDTVNGNAMKSYP